MVQRQRRYALFALGMIDVTVGSFVVALLDVRDPSMHLFFSLICSSNLIVILLRSKTEEVISRHFEAEP